MLLGKGRVVMVEQGYGCYCCVRIGEIGMTKGRAVRVGQG